VKLVYTTIPGTRIKYHVDYMHEPTKNSIVWNLDDEMNNDLEEDQGHWYVEAHPDDPSKARIFFEIGLVTPRWMPPALIRQYAKRAIIDSTSWVRSESEFEATGGKSAIPASKMEMNSVFSRLFPPPKSTTEEAEVSESEPNASEIAPFQQGRPSFVIDKDTERLLSRGEIADSMHVFGNSAAGKAVMDVVASKAAVWNQLLDFVSYADKMRGVKSSEVYKVEGRNSERAFVKFVNPVLPGVKLVYHVDHVYDPTNNGFHT